MATLIKYLDSQSEEYTYFWVHTFKDGVERVVSNTFIDEKEAIKWLEDIRKKMLSQHTLCDSSKPEQISQF